MPIRSGTWIIPAGSYEAIYWRIAHPITGEPLDLTAPGWSAAGAVAERADPALPVLHAWADADFERTATGVLRLRVPAAVSSAWAFPGGCYQVELTHPSGQPVRIADSRLTVTPEIVT
ncbi:MAG: hypothetical protein ABR608_12055 [Pseudonocardiaceae bacterium]